MVAREHEVVNTDLAALDTLIAGLHQLWLEYPDGAVRDQICARAATAYHERRLLQAKAGDKAMQKFFAMLAIAERTQRAREVGHG